MIDLIQFLDWMWLAAAGVVGFLYREIKMSHRRISATDAQLRALELELVLAQNYLNKDDMDKYHTKPIQETLERIEKKQDTTNGIVRSCVPEARKKS